MPLTFQRNLWVLAAAVFCALLIWRFVHLPNAPFLNDEPRLLVEVEKSFANHTWPKMGPVGSQPIPYGPIPHWFFQIARSLSASPFFFHQIHGLVFLGSTVLAFLLALYLYGISSALFVGLLLVSSPYLFIYSQMPWEVLLLIPGSVLVAFSLVAYESATKPLQWIQAGLIAGLGLGICLGTHLMASSLMIAFVLLMGFDIYRWQNWRRAGFFLLPALLIFCLLLSPYALGILEFLNHHHLSAQRDKNPLWGNGRQLWWSILKTPMHLSPWQMKGFFEPEEGLFFAFLPKWLERFFYFDLFGWLGKFFFWAAWVAIARSLWRRENVSSLVLLGWLLVPAHIFLLQLLNLATYPHYFLPLWWVPFLFLGRFWEHRWIGKLLLALVIGNLVYLFSLAAFVQERAGTRGDYYGTTYQEQENFFQAVCAREGSLIRLDLSQVRIQTHVANYFFLKLAACRGKSKEISKIPLAGSYLLADYAEGARLKIEERQ
jgi:hypothetical protein